MTSSSIWDVDRERFDEPPLRIIAGAVCNSCRRFDYVPIQPNNACYWCNGGTFTHRGNWTFTWCPACDGEDFFCKACHGKRIVATPVASLRQ
jgi:Zn ribbon nucleic-acid-binding protein